MSDHHPERRSALVERWDPMQELERVADRMRRTLDQTFGGSRWKSFPDDADAWVPPVDLEETDDAYLVEAELPGVNPQDVTVDIDGNELEITGEVKERKRTGTLRRNMRHSGRFAYRITLPQRADDDKIEASLTDGILTVHIPKGEKDRRRRIEIKS
jgi:HSP20 family protein